MFNILGEKKSRRCSKTIPKGPLANRWGMRWNASLKELEEISRFWSSL
jgi:hypothetical protein